MATFHPVTTQDDIEELARLAGYIWREYWPERIGADQTEYMIENFQSRAAIERDMANNGYRYWFIVDEKVAAETESAGAAADDEVAGWLARGIVGYTGGRTETETERFFISKIYLLGEARGRGYCSRTIDHYATLCQREGLRAMYLTVNKRNELGIRAYLANNFGVIKSVETDIGQGFIMDDYVMERPVGLMP